MMSLGIDTGDETSSEIHHSQVIAGVICCISFRSVKTISEQQNVCELIVEATGEPTALLPRHLQAYERFLAVQVVFSFNVDPMESTESTHLKIVFRLGTLARRTSWK